MIKTLRSMGSIVVKHVPITSYTGVAAIADAVVLPALDKMPYIIELKTGYDPTFTINKRYVYPYVCLGGHAISSDLRIAQLDLVPGLPLRAFSV